jgi:hypothetical protein
VRAAWKAMNSHTMVRKQSTSALEHVQVYRARLQGMVRTIAIGYEGKGPTVC